MVAVLQSMQFKSALLPPPRRESREGARLRGSAPGSSFPLLVLPSRSRVPARPRGELCGAGSCSRADGPGRARAFAGAAVSSAAGRWQGSALGLFQPAVRSRQTTALRLFVPSGGPRGKDPACQCRRWKRHEFDPWVGQIPGRRA